MEPSWAGRWRNLEFQSTDEFSRRTIVAFVNPTKRKIFLLLKVSSRLGTDLWIISDLRGVVIVNPTTLKASCNYFTPKNGYELKEFATENEFMQFALLILQ